MSHAEIEQEVALMRAAILAGVPYKAKPKDPSKKPRKSSPAGERKKPNPRAPKYSYEEIAKLRQEGLLTVEIAARLGAHRDTIRVALVAMGKPEPDKMGAPPREMCRRGLHKMSENSRPVKSGGRYCVPCKRDN